MDTEPSVKTIGKYEVVGVVGRGGMGVVYRAVDPAIGRTVAIKMLKGGYAGDRDLLQRFYREARSTGNLQHKNIVTVFALGDQDGIPYLVMEYLEGQAVSEIISSRRAMSLVEKLDLIIQICDGLHYAHCRNLIHRDIKPANVIVLPDGTSKIVDFGIARPTASQGLTQTGQVIGSPFYMSPEQINSDPLDARTDVFSTGVVLYELLTHELPFKGADTTGTFMKILSGGDPPALSKYLQDYPSELDEIVARALARRVGDRYQSAEELGFDLLQVQRDLREGMTKSYLQAAESCIRRGDLERARLQLLEVLKLDRQSEAANRLLRQVRQAQQQQQRKFQVAQMRSQAQIALAGQQYEEALACAEEACRLDPTDLDSENLREEIRKTIRHMQLLRGLLSRAESAMYAGELEDAQRSADEALRLAPDDAQARALVSAVEKELAARSRRVAIQNFVDSARQQISARDFVSAIDNLREAEKLDPSDSNVAELLRWANRGQEQEERRRALQDVLTHVDEALRNEDFVSACTMCDMGLSQFPDEPSVLKLRTIAERQQEVAKRRHFVQERSMAARRLAEVGQHQGALDLLAEALRRYPEEPNLETLRALINDELELLTRERLERERQQAADEAARQQAARVQKQVLHAAAQIRLLLDEQQDFTAAGRLSSEVEQILASEVLDQKTRDVGIAIVDEFHSRAAAREQALAELQRLVSASDSSPNPVLRSQAGQRALAIQAAYSRDSQIQALYAAVTANLEDWSQRRGHTIAELTNIARSIANLPLPEANRSLDRAGELSAPFESDPEVGSLLQQICNECQRRERDRQRLLENLSNLDNRVAQARSLIELNEVLAQANALVSAHDSDSETSSAISKLKATAEKQRRDMEAVIGEARQLMKQIDQAATVDTAERLLEKAYDLVAANPDNLDVQELVTRTATQVRGRRAEHDLISQELSLLRSSLSQSQSAEELTSIRQRSTECRKKDPQDPEIIVLCDEIEAEASRLLFVQEQSAAARQLVAGDQHESAFELLHEALRRYPEEPNLQQLHGEVEQLWRERQERERQQAAEEAARQRAVMRQRALDLSAQLRRSLDEQDFAAASSIAFELQELPSEVLDQQSRDAATASVSEFQSRLAAREDALQELQRLILSADTPDSASRKQAGERAQAVGAAYPKDKAIQAAYVAVTAELQQWAQRRAQALAELGDIARSLPQVPLDRAKQSSQRAGEIAASFETDSELSSVWQQIREGFEHRVLEQQQVLNALEKLAARIPQARLLAELKDMLAQGHALAASQASDVRVASVLSQVEAAGDQRRAALEALVREAEDIAEQANQAATLKLAETLLEKGSRLAAEHPENLDAQEVVTRLFTQVSGRRTAHDEIVKELSLLRSNLVQSQSAEGLIAIRQRSTECREKHPQDPEIIVLCNEIEAGASRQLFVQEQSAAARQLVAGDHHESAFELLHEALRRYPEEPNLQQLHGEVEQLWRERQERERPQAAEQAAREDALQALQGLISSADTPDSASRKQASEEARRRQEGFGEEQDRLRSGEQRGSPFLREQWMNLKAAFSRKRSETSAWENADQNEPAVQELTPPRGIAVTSATPPPVDETTTLNLQLPPRNLNEATPTFNPNSADALLLETRVAHRAFHLLDSSEAEKNEVSLSSVPRNAQGWSDDLLIHIEKQLAAFIGPLAKVIVRRAASKTADWNELYRRIAESLESESERQAFLACKDEPNVPLAPSDRVQRLDAATGGVPQDDLSRSEVGPEVIAQAKRSLARYVGPISSVLVRNAARRAGSVRDLYFLLAKELENEAEREQFLRDGGFPREGDLTS